MNAEHIEQLSDALDDGNQGKVYWKQKATKFLFEVLSITENSEGSSVVTFENDHKEYPLKEFNFDDFYLVRPVSDLFE